MAVLRCARRLLRFLEDDDAWPLRIETADGVVHWRFVDDLPIDPQIAALEHLAQDS